MELKIHPLINLKDSSHYDSHGGEPAIVRFERKYTVSQLMAWAEITKAKYDDPGRKNKGQIEADIRKSESYDRYFHMLYAIIEKNSELGEVTPEKAYEALNMQWRYR